MIHLYVNATNDGDNDGNDYIAFVLPTTQASTNSLVAADIDDAGPVNGATEVTNRLDITNMATPGYYVWTVQPAYLPLINTTGVTRLGIREGHDLLNDPVATGRISRIKWNSDNQASNRPFMTVTCQ